MTLKILGTTLLAATGVCGTAAVWSHARQAEQPRHSGRARFSRRDGGEFRGNSRMDSRRANDVGRDFMPRRMQGDQAWENRGR